MLNTQCNIVNNNRNYHDKASTNILSYNQYVSDLKNQKNVQLGLKTTQQYGRYLIVIERSPYCFIRFFERIAMFFEGISINEYKINSHLKSSKKILANPVNRLINKVITPLSTCLAATVAYETVAKKFFGIPPNPLIYPNTFLILFGTNLLSHYSQSTEPFSRENGMLAEPVKDLVRKVTQPLSTCATFLTAGIVVAKFFEIPRYSFIDNTLWSTITIINTLMLYTKPILPDSNFEESTRIQRRKEVLI